VPWYNAVTANKTLSSIVTVSVERIVVLSDRINKKVVGDDTEALRGGHCKVKRLTTAVGAISPVPGNSSTGRPIVVAVSVQTCAMW